MLAQPHLRVETAEARHLRVENHAVGAAVVEGFEERQRRTERARLESARIAQPPQRDPYGFFIVNDGYQRLPVEHARDPCEAAGETWRPGTDCSRPRGVHRARWRSSVRSPGRAPVLCLWS